MTSKSLGQIAYRKPLAKCGMEELAARQAEINPSGGVLFARTENRQQKDAARQLVLDLFQPMNWNRSLRMLTMPGVSWRFERLLLGAREVGWLRSPKPKRTSFLSAENDRAIYVAACAQMPGLHNPHSEVKSTKPFPFAELTMKTQFAAFAFANVDDMMQYEWTSGFDAAWLDYTGPLTTERMAIIRRFYERHVHHYLIVTALKARWNQRTSDVIGRAGGHSQWLRNNLEGNVLHDIEYLDTVPMAQFAIHKRQWWKCPLC